MAQQHVDLFRKVLLRKHLLKYAAPGAVYVPFIGDGDLAEQLYTDRRIYGADIDPDRTAVAASKLPTADIRTADCDSWVFPGLTDTFAVADFDAYAFPYPSFRSFWPRAQKADRMVMFFTDGQGINIEFKGRWRTPDGVEHRAPGFEVGKAAGDVNVRRSTWAFWFSKHIWPWFVDYIGPEWRVIQRFRYIRGVVVYWGVAIERVALSAR